eukprot:GAHX01004536.1.p2 GENE.GAHX01004536.1~~GAHX01004536.1.p2  ORF type:complete len:72 (+),score=10.75 GAHX01004536.1:145-360(+)
MGSEFGEIPSGYSQEQVLHQLCHLTTAQQKIFQVVLKVNLIKVLPHIIKVPLCKEEILGLVQEFNMTEENF